MEALQHQLDALPDESMFEGLMDLLDSQPASTAVSLPDGFVFLGDVSRRAWPEQHPQQPPHLAQYFPSPVPHHPHHPHHHQHTGALHLPASRSFALGTHQQPFGSSAFPLPYGQPAQGGWPMNEFLGGFSAAALTGPADPPPPAPLAHAIFPMDLSLAGPAGLGSIASSPIASKMDEGDSQDSLAAATKPLVGTSAASLPLTTSVSNSSMSFFSPAASVSSAACASAAAPPASSAPSAPSTPSKTKTSKSPSRKARRRSSSVSSRTDPIGVPPKQAAKPRGSRPRAASAGAAFAVAPTSNDSEKSEFLEHLRQLVADRHECITIPDESKPDFYVSDPVALANAWNASRGVAPKEKEDGNSCHSLLCYYARRGRLDSTKVKIGKRAKNLYRFM
eukprot:m.23476 g.23476  ORF g.23476 m.23476 type:complete len:392 (-) comp4127_c0_seq1:843-2018(-)